MPLKKKNAGKFPGPIAQANMERARRIYATTTATSRVLVKRSDGCFVYDYDGFKFIDFHCDAGVNNLGKGNKNIHRAIQKQLRTNNEFSEMHNAPNLTALDLAELLIERSPVAKPSKMFFSNSGAEANEAARKLCMGYRYHRGETHRKKAIYFTNGFAGRTTGDLPATTSKPEVQRDPFWTHCDKENSMYLPYPRAGEDWQEMQKQFEALPHNEIDRMLVEIPCQGEGGIIPIEESALHFLYDRCRVEQILVIADCVQTGMGRTGTLFGADCFSWFQPDILTMGKALGGYLPIGATIFHENLDWRVGEHSNTFGGGPLVAVSAMVAFNEMDALIRSNMAISLEYLLKNWLLSFCEYTIVTEVRGRGAMWGIEFQNAALRKRVIHLGEEFAEYKGCGLRLLGAGRNVVRIMPPLNISHSLLNHGMMILKEIIEIIEMETQASPDLGGGD